MSRQHVERCRSTCCFDTMLVWTRLYGRSIVVVSCVTDRYYDDVRNMPTITDQDMNTMLYEESLVCRVDWNA